MSEKLCTLRTKGGGGGAKQEETVLWTNSNPSSSFSPATVTLSDDVNNYDYLKFTFAYNSSSSNTPYSEIIPVDVLKLANWNICADVTGAGYHYTRLVNYATDTTISIGNSYRWNGSTAGAPSNTTCIPLAIIGIKNMGGGTSVKSQFKEVFICSSPGASSDALASRGYNLENVQSGDTITGDAYNTTYLTATYTSGSTGYCTVTAKSDITAMVLKGYNTATYTVQNYTTGQVVGTCNRKSGDFLLIGIL